MPPNTQRHRQDAMQAYVSDKGDDENDGLSPEAPVKSLKRHATSYRCSARSSRLITLSPEARAAAVACGMLSLAAEGFSESRVRNGRSGEI